MSSGLSLPTILTTQCTTNEARRTTTLSNRFEEPLARQQRLHRTGKIDAWAQQSTQSTSSASLNRLDTTSASYSPVLYSKPRIPEKWPSQESLNNPDRLSASPWAVSPLMGHYSNQPPMSPGGAPSPRVGYGGWVGSWPGPLLRRTSSDDVRLNQVAQSYYSGDTSAAGLSRAYPQQRPTTHDEFDGMFKAHPQRRPSNRDEFDGPSQMLNKPEDGGYEPKEEELPQLPIHLYAQEQDDILSQVNDRLSQCAFDFVAKYQFPIPIEPDKRPVRVPSDREWSEWVYLLKRLATKRRIPARVLYNGQIKQLITILENSLEMRHAAKHQSRPLKDDRNILQLISSGLQVAKIVKDAPAMQYLDSLYTHTERLIHSRRATAQSTFGSMSTI